MARDLAVLVLGRSTGKTTEAVEWLKGGVKASGYPGWSRVLVVPTQAMYRDLRMRLWNTVPDVDHRIYDFLSWAGARHVNPDTHVVIDEFTSIPGSPHSLPGIIVGVTICGTPVTSLEAL